MFHSYRFLMVQEGFRVRSSVELEEVIVTGDSGRCMQTPLARTWV